MLSMLNRIKLKKRILLQILSASLIISSCSKNEKYPSEFLEKTSNFLTKKSSITYDIDYGIKFFDYDDTSKVKTTVTIIRDDTDSVFGGSFYYTIKDSSRHISKYYDLKKLHVINHNLGEITTYETVKGQTWPISGTMDGQVLNTYFTKPKNLINLANSLKNKISFENKPKYFTIDVNLPDDEPVNNQKKTVKVNKKKSLIKEITFEAHLDNQVQYNRWEMSNIIYDKETLTDLEDKFVKSTNGYLLKIFEQKSSEELAPLKTGTKAPFFDGSDLFTENETTLGDFKNKVIVLDFWYRSCYPCIQSIPSLINISTKYKDVIVLGVNPVNTRDTDREKLIEFVNYKKINYPILISDNDNVASYKVHAYPTLYIIDTSGNIAYSKVGFHENQENTIDSVIMSLRQ